MDNALKFSDLKLELGTGIKLVGLAKSGASEWMVKGRSLRKERKPKNVS